MSVQPTRAATGSGLAAFTPAKNGRNRDSPSAARNPTYIARPPIVGFGSGCTRRSDGWSITPTEITKRRTSGVTANVTPAAVRNRARYACTSEVSPGVPGAATRRYGRRYGPALGPALG